MPGCLPCPPNTFANYFGATGCTRINGMSNRCPAGSGLDVTQISIPGVSERVMLSCYYNIYEERNIFSSKIFLSY